ncbi:18826_t:CDS:2 [Gigaspora margarita]|uniref:18826_t:CDS:1 n=1 Tax=Gigaspora margarita TaxID=4874 RepID=A0ABM8W7C9_GIGMA|nr:18826_t:CDS:2 [Gigaspora margarita]
MESIMPKLNDEFESLENFENTAKLAAKAHGFTFSRKDINLTEHKKKSFFVVLQCTKGGKWRNNWNISEETQTRKKYTRRDRCPVYIRAVARKKYHSTVDVSNPEVIWVVTKVILNHNHSMLKIDEIASFPQHRIMNLNQKSLLQKLHDSNAPTRVITTAVNKITDGGIIHPKDIVNKRACIRLALNEDPNNNFTQKLLKLLEECNYMVVPLKTTKGHLTHLFFSHVEVIKCVARCSEVLIIDYTYKTNIYKYPLVSAVGINNIGSEKGALATYQIAMAWMEDEKVFMSDRDQALRNASYKVFPESNKMLCVWHLLEQNLRTNCRKLFKDENNYELFKKEDEALRFALSKEQIPQLLNAVKKAAEKSHTPKKVISYIQTWMKDADTWILAYTKNYCYMGISTTGRSESSHRAFKQAIETASDLESVFRQIDQTMRLQHLKASMRLGSNKVAVDPFTLRNPKFSELIGNISIWAIDNIKRTLQKMKENPTENKNIKNCECPVKINYKLPCPHVIPMDSLIPLSIIHKRWLLERSDIIIEIPKLVAVDSEFYDTFIKAEENFQKLPDNASKIDFITKLYQVINVPLPEPIKLLQKTVPKGSHSNTKRELLLSERQDATAAKKKKKTRKYHEIQKKTMQQQRVPLEQIFNTSGLSNCKLYEANIPKFMREHVSAYLDVIGDGNCGFRAIAVSIKKPEDYWSDVRKLIYNELCDHKSHYIHCF